MIPKHWGLVLGHVSLVERLPAFHCTMVVLPGNQIPCPGSGPSIRLCMNEQKTQVKTKGFYSKNAKYKKKNKISFPCTVFHSDKTSRLHAAQTGSGRHIMPAGTASLSMYSQQCPFPDRAKTSHRMHNQCNNQTSCKCLYSRHGSL